jgi:hypothetical protein
VGTLESTVDNFEADGLTLVNSVVNGDFSNGTTGWSAVSATFAVSNNIMSVTGNGGGAIPYVFQDDVITNIDEVIFSYAKVRVTNSDSQAIFGRLSGGSSGNFSVISNPIQNQWYELYGKLTKVTNNTDIRIYQQYADATTANGKVIEVDGNAGVFAINMTALGIASYTEAQMLDLVRSGYFDGIANVEKPSVTAVGKNLFDINNNNTNQVNAQIIDRTENSITLQGAFFTGFNLKLKGSQTYILSATITTISGTPSSAWTVLYEDDTIGPFVGINLPITATKNIKSVLIYAGGGTVATIKLTNPQLELGSTATTYEPYKSSTLTIDTELRSLPNGVRDRVYEQNGEVWLEKRVSDNLGSTIKAQSSWVVDTSITNTIRFYKLNVSAFLSKTSSLTSNLNNILSLGGKVFRVVGVGDTGGTIDEEVVGLSIDGTIAIRINKTKLSTLDSAGFEAYLQANNVDFYLEPPTPQLINLTQEGKVDGELIAFENGTIYNTSDTFHADISFDVASNRSAQITGLLESASYQAKQIDTKANKVQEDWIEPTLLNGWVNLGGDFATAGYMKDEFGFVHIKGVIKDGTATADIQLFLLPNGYRPSQNLFLPIISNNTIGAVLIGVGGEVLLRSGNNSFVDLSSISFRVEE